LDLSICFQTIGLSIQFHIHRVLHDDLQQRAYAILMQMSFLRQELPSENHSARKEASEIENELAEIVKITRNLSIDLSPPTLSGEGLSHAIEWLVSRMREQYSLHVELQADGPFVISNQELHVFVFNCIRELLFNVLKHAGASRAVVAMAWLDNAIQIEVRDDGKRFPVSIPDGAGSRQDNLPRSLGLPSIHHQLSLFGGSMEINSTPRAGTQVILIVPI
jgi:signal transduction histidine kinase